MAMVASISLPPIEVSSSEAAALAARRDQRPNAVASFAALDERRDFLRRSLGNAREAEDTYERVIQGDELQSITYLERGTIAARAVARIELHTPSGGLFGYGTGFLIAPGVLITNNHVLPDSGSAARAIAQFHYEVDLDDAPRGPTSYQLDPAALYYTSADLDFTVVAVNDAASDGATPLAQFGCLPLLDVTGKASEGEWLTIVQHPNGERKQVCVRENQLLKREGDVLWYSTDTMPGSSGSPVFNNDWFVVALHHRGVAEGEDGKTKVVVDDNTKWIGNEGIRASRIAQTLKQALPNHRLLQPLFSATPATARISEPGLNVPAPSPPTREMTNMAQNGFPLDIRLQVSADGQVRMLPAGQRQGTESATVDAAQPEKTVQTASFDPPFDNDYEKRKGFDPDFLGGGAKRVGFPKLGRALEAVAAPLVDESNGKKYILHYHNYSVVIHKTRRLAIYSAANVSFGGRFNMNRPPDVWRRDPRILAEYQIENWYYASNKFDRGHLTRREDLEFGDDPQAALISASDTCHWTNCTPQHERFNQNREIWQGIERYILESSIYNNHINAQIITGPILDGGDPEYRKLQYPLQFWKIVAALDSKGSLFATAYLAGQEEVIAQFGIEITEVPFGAYKTFQTKIAEIERLTGLTFVSGAKDQTPLRSVDPLESAPARPRRASATETTGTPLPPNYYEIMQLEDIRI